MEQALVHVSLAPSEKCTRLLTLGQVQCDAVGGVHVRSGV